MQFQKLTFKNAEGVNLSARLDLPADERPTAYALFAHCFTCTKNLKAVVNINRALALNGIAVLRFDFTGLGESEGDFADTNFSSNVADLVSAADFLGSRFEAPKLLIGHSLGGAAVLQAAAKIPSAVAVATIAAPADPSNLARFLRTADEEIEKKGEGEITLAGSTFKIKKQFLDDLDQVRMKETIGNLNRALLVLHSPQDQINDIKNAMEIFDAAHHPKGFISLDGADHLLSDRRDSIYVGSILGAWSRRYLGIEETNLQQREVTESRVVVRTGKFGYQTEIIASGHRLIADEPIAEGGGNTGPTPYDYLVSALGACTSMTLRMYADRKKWPVEGIVVRLNHKKIHAADCRECESQNKKIDHIEREIELNGPIDEEKRRRLLEIANRCPVHRTLKSEISIESRLRE
jgi:uncharacterized OsmC-like protein/alpha/beta superfamily hydrolase